MTRRLRYQRMSGVARSLLRSEGESGRFEFKRDATAVSADVLVAAANAVVLDDLSETYVTILVGVDEVENPQTGVVTGIVVGIGNLEQARTIIRDRASATLPSPVALTIIEENTETRRPFLRLEVGPTTAPHFTGTGRRITRYGASTRAITDEELLGLYLDREGEHFRERFSAAVRSVEAEVSAIGSTLDQMHQALDSVVDDASTGATAAEDVQFAIDDLPGADYFDDKFAELSGSLKYTTDGEVWVALQQARRDGWEKVRRVVADNPRNKEVREAAELLRSLPVPVPGAHAPNLEELRGWESLDWMLAFSRDRVPEHLLTLAQEMMERRARAAHPTRMIDLPPID